MSDSTITQVHPDASDLTDDLFTSEESDAYFSSLLAKRTKADESMTPTQGKYLTWLVCSLYPEWDEEGVMAAIGHAVACHPDKGAALVTLAILGWASDGTNLAPGGVSVPGRHWARAGEFLSAPTASTAPDPFVMDLDEKPYRYADPFWEAISSTPDTLGSLSMFDADANPADYGYDHMEAMAVPVHPPRRKSADLAKQDIQRAADQVREFLGGYEEMVENLARARSTLIKIAEHHGWA